MVSIDALIKNESQVIQTKIYILLEISGQQLLAFMLEGYLNFFAS